MPNKASSGRLVLTDIENLTGQSPRNLEDRDICRLADALQDLLEIDDSDEVVVACNPRWEPAVRASWTGCHLRVRGGRDGADLELVQHARRSRIARHQSLWIVGGDKRLVQPARMAKAMGIRTVVVAIETCLSREVRQEADRVVPFTPFPTTQTRRYAA